MKQQNKVFYNRVRETENLSKYISEVKHEEAQIIIVAGSEGIGKTSLVNNLLESKLTSTNYIKVSTLSGRNTSITEYLYISKLYEYLVNFAKRKRNFNIPTPLQRTIILNPKSILKYIGELILSFRGISKPSPLIEPTITSGIIKKKEYIIDTLKENKFIIGIENLQNIDTESFEQLLDIIKRTPQTCYIFEYTTPQGDVIDSSLIKIMEKFNEVISKPNLLTVKKLPFDEAKKIVSNKHSEEKISNAYKKSQGNLFYLHSLDIENANDNDESLKSSIMNLGKIKLFILYTLFLNESPMSENELLKFLPSIEKCTIIDIEKELTELLTANLITLSNGELQIAHSSIQHELNEDIIQKLHPSITFASYDWLKKHYLNLFSVNPSDDVIEHLFQLFVRFSDKDISLLLPYIKKIIKKRKYRKKIIEAIIQYQKKIKESGNILKQQSYEINLMLTELCIECGIHDEAEKVFQEIKKNTPYHNALQFLIFALEPNYAQALKKIKNLRKKISTDYENLISDLAEMKLCMEYQKSDQTKRIAKKIEENPQYSHYFEYAFFLRNYAELIDDFEIKCDYYSRAIKKFREYNRNDLVAETYVLLCMEYAYYGKLSEAHEYLALAQELHNIKEAHIQNNTAVLSILENRISEDTFIQLNDSLLLIEDLYEELIVRCNLMVAYIKINELNNAAEICKSIENSDFEQFQYEEFLHIIYQNLFFYYSIQGDKNKASYYRNKLSNLSQREGIREFTRNLILCQLKNQKNKEIFYSQFPFRVDFLGEWGIELNSIEERFQQ